MANTLDFNTVLFLFDQTIHAKGQEIRWTMNILSVSFCLPHPVAVSAFMICRGLCACTEMLWMCVLYVSFGFKVRPRTFGCVAMGSALLCIFRSRLLVNSEGSGVNRVQIVLSRFSMRLFCLVQEKPLCRYGCIYFLAALVRVCVDVIVMSSA